MLGWLWDLSVTEEHIFSKAFFYFVCLDIMLYSGTCGLGMYRKVGVRWVCRWGAAAVRAGVLRPLGFGLERPLGLGRAERGGRAEEPSGRSRRTVQSPGHKPWGVSCQLKGETDLAPGQGPTVSSVRLFYRTW